VKLNQAFEILAKSGNAHDARIVLDWILSKCDIRKHMSIISYLVFRISVSRAAWKLRRGIPVAKIVGKKWFYGLEFETGGATLDPRPDSEILVEAVLGYVSSRGIGAFAPMDPGSGQDQALKNISDRKNIYNSQPHQVPDNFSHSAKNFRDDTCILDLGTGTGCLICSIIKNIPNATGIGIDKSMRACRVARRNVRNLGLDDRIKIIRKDFKSQIINHKSQFDIIISNPPYIATGDPQVDAGARHDPKMALYAGADGLSAYRAIAKSVRRLLKPGGQIFLEIGADQGNAVREIFAANSWKFASAHNDLGGIERVLAFE
jgi:release factor glutamine methyltransferase